MQLYYLKQKNRLVKKFSDGKMIESQIVSNILRLIIFQSK